MEQLFYEIASAQLNKFNEELCGDAIMSNHNHETSTVILADGLGSGVKANILATLTSRIISVMLKNGSELDDVVDTLIETLPTCSYRKLAYSTFSVAQLYNSGKAHLVEYDNPPAIVIKKNKIYPVEYTESTVRGKLIKESLIPLEHGDWLILVSDGEVHAGIGGMWNLGWSWERIAEFIERIVQKPISAHELAFELTNIANQLYADKPGDDTSVAVIKVREKRQAKVLIGAPAMKSLDKFVVNRFMADDTKKIVCGGTTSNIVGRILGKEVGVDLDSIKPGVPPIGTITGIDLVTEGIITISSLLKLLKENKEIPLQVLNRNHDGVSLLLKELLDADEITFLIGQAMNPAHQNPGIPKEFGLKTKITEDIAKCLNKLNKKIEIEYY